jgi:hypothetical protein
MERLKHKVNWPEEIRNFLEGKIEEIRKKESIAEAEKLLKDLPTNPKGTITSLVRESRDDH